MAVPFALRRQIEEAERLHAEVYGAEKDTADPALSFESNAGGEVQEEDGVTDAAGQADGVYDGGQLAADGESDAQVEQGEGRGDELNRLLYQIDALERRVALLAQQVEQVKQARLDLPKPSIAFDSMQLVSDADIDDYGEDFARLSERMLKRMGPALVEHVVKALGDRMAPAVDEVVGAARRDAAIARGQLVWAQLKAAIPNAAQVNADPDWLKWLQGKDQVSGMVRQEMLTSAYNNGDADRVIAIMRAYLDSKIPPGKKSKRDLADFAGPQRTVAAAPKNSEAKQVLTSEMISRTYADFLRQRQRTRDPAKLAQIDAAEKAFSERVQRAHVDGLIA
jgi:hypothetical protein